MKQTHPALRAPLSRGESLVGEQDVIPFWLSRWRCHFLAVAVALPLFCCRGCHPFLAVARMTLILVNGIDSVWIP
jgi:hypothetical protein